MMGCSIAVAGMIYYSHAQTKDAAAATPTAAAPAATAACTGR